MKSLPTAHVALILIMIFFAITFLQSAADKVIDRDGNLSFFKDHFKGSLFKNRVSPLLSVLTLVEFVTGSTAIAATVEIIVFRETDICFFALVIAGINLLMLLLGQRLAKDYAGAATIGNYLILIVAGFLLLK